MIWRSKTGWALAVLLAVIVPSSARAGVGITPSTYQLVRGGQVSPESTAVADLAFDDGDYLTVSSEPVSNRSAFIVTFKDVSRAGRLYWAGKASSGDQCDLKLALYRWSTRKWVTLGTAHVIADPPADVQLDEPVPGTGRRFVNKHRTKARVSCVGFESYQLSTDAIQLATS